MNHEKLKRVMRHYGVGNQEVADILNCSYNTISQYRCRSGSNISDFALYYLKSHLKETVKPQIKRRAI